MADESHASPQDKESIEASVGHHLVRFLASEASAPTHEVDKGYSDGAIYVQDQVFTLLRRDLLYLQSILEDLQAERTRVRRGARTGPV